MSAAHNTVVVDGLDLANVGGKTLWWQDGEHVRGLSVSAPGMIEGEIFERTVVVVDTDVADSYIVDVFRVQGGIDHTRFVQGPYGPLTTSGLSLSSTSDYGHDTLMRAFQSDAAPIEGWTADWRLDDLAELAPTGSQLHLRYTDLSRGVEAGICESWACYGNYGRNNRHNSKDEVCFQRPWLRRRAEPGAGDLASTFVGLLEPYDTASAVVCIQRTDGGDGLRADEPVELSVELKSGSKDVIKVQLGGSVTVMRDGVDQIG
jgi:hypothetical protein